MSDGQATEEVRATSADRAPVGEAIETGRRLSKSSIWRLQREFFDRQGVKAWSERRVPSHVTSNAYIAEAYLQVALRFIEDCSYAQPGSPLALDVEQPIYIVEMGAGHGYFGYLFLCKLLEMRELIPFPMPPVCYVLTDFAQSNVEAWRGHERLHPFFESGLLDVAQFDAERDAQLHLQVSDTTLSAKTVKNPMVFVGNYVFDSLSHDVFRIADGKLEEGLVTLRMVQPENEESRDILEHISLEYDYRPVDGVYYPEDPVALEILSDYGRRLGDTAFCFPLGGLRCLQNLEQMSGGRMLVLSADKGYAHEVDLLSLGDPFMAHHNGCVSMMVNFHAMGELVASKGGFMLAQDGRNAALEICAFVLSQGAPMPETRLGFEAAMERVGPNDVYRLLEHVAFDKMSLDQLLSVLRMASWDPATFLTLSKDLHRCAGDAFLGELTHLREALQRVWKLYFPLDDGKDVAFELGFVYYAMRRYREAMEFYQRSLETYGAHHVTLFNMGLCEFQQGNLAEALRRFESSLELDASYGPARDWRLRVQAEGQLDAKPPGRGEAKAAELSSSAGADGDGSKEA